MNTSDIIKHLQDTCNLILAGYGGSYAYGTNIPTSDIDIRGIYLNPEDEIFGIRPDSEQITIPNEDVTIYSIKKMFHLLLQCNPNTIEILGLRPQDYLYLSPTGQLIIDNAHIFLSKKAINTFGAYAKSQLNRLVNKSGRAKDQSSENETRSLDKVIQHLKTRESLQNIKVKNMENKPVLFINESMSIEQFYRVSQEILNVHSDYKHSVRNSKAIEHGKLSKHMMHLIRLYIMGIDILEKQEIITYRADEHDLLMSIRNGEYLEEDNKTISTRFTNILNDYTAHFEEAAEHTNLPDNPDYNTANQLLIKIIKDNYK